MPIALRGDPRYQALLRRVGAVARVPPRAGFVRAGLGPRAAATRRAVTAVRDSPRVPSSVPVHRGGAPPRAVAKEGWGGPDRRVTLANTGVLRRSRPGGGLGGGTAAPIRRQAISQRPGPIRVGGQLAR